MVRHFFLIAIRNIFRHKVFTFINLIGLSVSLAICLLVIKIIFALYSSDRFHQYKNQIFRVTTEVKTTSYDEYELATSPAPLKDELLQYGEIESVVRIWNRFSDDAISSDKPMPVSGYFVDEEFLDIFSFNLLYGNVEDVLQEPFSIILTKEWSDKYFGDVNPIGKTIEFHELGIYTVNKKSHMKFDLVASSKTLLLKTADLSVDDEEKEESPYDFAKVLTTWKDVYRTYTYIKIKEGAEKESLFDYFPNIIKKHYNDPDTEYTFNLQPLTRISPGRNLSNALGHVDDPSMSYILSIIAIIITLTASFTYTNLSIARSLSRAKEVGIRKVIGARRYQLIFQFIFETMVLSFISLNLAYIILIFIEPEFYNIDPFLKQSFYLEEHSIWLYITTIVFTILLAILIGYIPSRYMSKVSPSVALKNLFKGNARTGINMKKVIIIFQFSVSLVLIYSITIMYRQIDFQQSIDLGFDPEKVISIDLYGNDYETFQNELSTNSSIYSISAVNYLPSIGTRSMSWTRQHDQIDSVICSNLIASPTILETLGIDLIAGEGFKSGIISENEKYTVISKSALRILGYEHPNDALGSSIIIDGDEESTIVGVCSDIVLQSADRGPEALIFRVRPENMNHLLIRYNAGVNVEELISSIGVTWDKIDSVNELKYEFYTSKIEEYYSSPKSMLKILSAIAFFAVLISFMGLFGIVMYSTENRIKEVGIRKVFGAETKQILWTISRRFMIMIIGAILITTPVVWIAGEMILQNFYYRVTISIEHFLTGMTCMLVLGLLTIFAQTVRAAYKNPVDTLRYE
jgi:putative ABC transport system permease protein